MLTPRINDVVLFRVANYGPSADKGGRDYQYYTNFMNAASEAAKLVSSSVVMVVWEADSDTEMLICNYNGRPELVPQDLGIRRETMLWKLASCGGKLIVNRSIARDYQEQIGYVCTELNVPMLVLPD